MQVFAALADPTRLHIVELLAVSGQLSVADINERFHISAPAVSQHLKVLREAQLVRVEARAQQRLYSLDPTGVATMEHWVAQLRQHWNERFDALDALLAEQMKKSQPKKKVQRPTRGRRK